MRITGGKILIDLFNEMLKHTVAVKKCVDLLKIIVENYRSLSESDLGKVYSELNNLEHEADDMKRELFDLIKLSRVHPDDKENLYRFVIYVDEIADLSKAIAKKFIIMKHLNLEIPEEVLRHMVKMLDSSVIAVDNVLQLVRSYIEEIPGVTDVINTIEKHEKEVDEVRLNALEQVYKLCTSNYNVLCMALPIVIDDIESITDRCHNIAEVYRIYTISR